MSISSRTPEGFPSRCAICDTETNVEYSSSQDAPCPNCGSLLWKTWVKFDRLADIVSEQLGVDKKQITSGSSFANDLGADSLDLVELVMELEEELDINIPDEEAEKIKTFGDIIRYLQERGGKS